MLTAGRNSELPICFFAQTSMYLMCSQQAGQGTGNVLRVSVGPDTSDLQSAETLFDYDPPIVTGVSGCKDVGSWTTDCPTRGEQHITV